jgi:hypothetical protein
MVRKTEYRAVWDQSGQYVGQRAKRRFAVLRYVDGTFAWMTGSFATMAAAETRARACNAEAAAEEAKAAFYATKIDRSMMHTAPRGNTEVEG